MTMLEMITEWRKGRSCGPHNPANCPDCTAALIDALERELIKQSRCSDGASSLRPIIRGSARNSKNIGAGITPPNLANWRVSDEQP